MKRALKTLAWTLPGCLAAFWLLLLFLPSDVVKSRYATLQAARDDSLFEGGWLPDILPPSSQDIVTVHNLDLNEASGEFRFAPEHYPWLLARTRPAVRQGREMRIVSQDDDTWVFDCNGAEGRCSYRNERQHP
ncbi:hypothetical protein [Massilia agri]|uniref:YbbD head domain-containing protein n=1 Tax=Massilia agri TaxID=1886785 RepID=A0ABT2AK41_9BURK|nr:hypothetical protein [Massilia agri]MCS0596609.1 hypothetical protein [Massilia agri]